MCYNKTRYTLQLLATLLYPYMVLMKPSTTNRSLNTNKRYKLKRTDNNSDDVSKM